MGDIVRIINGRWHIDVTDKVIESARVAGITPKYMVSRYYQDRIIQPCDDCPSGAILKYRWKDKRCYMYADPLPN